jgi:hypothetical protein
LSFGGSRYITGEVTREETFSLSKMLMNILYMYMYKFFEKDSLYVKLYFVGLCLMNAITFHIDMMRISYYFLSVQIIVYADYIHKHPKQIANALLIWAYAIFTFFYIMILSDQCGLVSQYALTNKFHY